MLSMPERYRQAASLAPENLLALMRNRRIDPTWTGDGDTFWYRRETDIGDEQFVLVDPVAATRRGFPPSPGQSSRQAPLLV
jgi:dipeptidyl-peptidase-4